MDIQSIWMQCFSFFPFLVGLPFLEPLDRKPGSIAAGTHSSNAPGFVTRFARAGALAHVPCSHMPPAFIATGSTLAPRQRFQPHTRPTVWSLQGDSVGRMVATTINSSKLLDLYLSLPRHWAFPGFEPCKMHMDAGANYPRNTKDVSTQVQWKLKRKHCPTWNWDARCLMQRQWEKDNFAQRKTPSLEYIQRYERWTMPTQKQPALQRFGSKWCDEFHMAASNSNR